MKSKKILAGILAVTMMFGGMAVNSNVLEDIGFGITASAVDKGTVNCSTNAEISTALSNLSEGDSIVINVTSDTTDKFSFEACGSNITINLNGYTLNQFSIHQLTSYKQILTINGDGGKIKGADATAYYASVAAEVSKNNKLVANDVSLIGGNGIGIGVEGDYAIQCSSANATVELNNCYVSAGGSTDDSIESVSALVGEVGTTVKVKNTTFTRQNGVILSAYPLIRNATLMDFKGNEITKPDYTISTFKVGLSSITQEDKSPAQAQTPVTAKTNIPEPTYTVTIPADVDFGSQTQALEKYRAASKDQFGNAVTVTKDFTVSATRVVNLFNDLDDGKTDSLTVTASFDGNLIGTTDTSNKVSYKILQDGKALATGDKIATFYNNVDLKEKGKTNTATATVSMNRCDIKNADNYKSIVTFNIAVTDK